ncbi:hypothetical protein LMJF_22_0630 [Leishmania major strain Friedlin]|uniref:Uncharacterized protein n=1 Tax=Leishmania major TaxID=5664 RepID=Q4QBT4_LEIMA|nr:hypothetical protein LMJF_22_0630 [Leishmania major strain Friedlin]CAG9573929.1 hypothetical_protein_-_conserved [Leishmania major strain Friedlin]CAJ04232.1 hypothetical protein LMJF_22_0630 [Leishmania major strain Friedlin]|eukprot:XP_001683214.1 hypothetical protein LMJF_22_0630 [Leishmania major strain Friedlin]
MLQTVQQSWPRRGRDFVLPEVPILESPEWSDEDDDINRTRTPLSVETEARAPAARIADSRPMLSPAMRLPPMVRGASPPFAHQMAPPSAGFNHPCSYEAARVSDSRSANEGNHRFCASRKANGGGDTGVSATPCSGDAARKQHSILNVGPRECWPVDGHNGDDSDSPPQMSIGPFVSVRGPSCFPFEAGSLFVSSTHHLGDDDDESSSAATGSSNSSSDTDRTRTSSDSTDSSSNYQQQRASMSPFSHGSTQVGGLLGGGGCPQQPSAPSYGIEVGPSIFVRLPQQNPSLLDTPVAGRTGLITAAEAAPSIFRTFFHEDDGSYDMTGFHHDSASAFHQDDTAALSMTLSAASARAANGGARVAISCGREGRADATNSAAAGTHQDSSNHTITTVSGDGGLQRGPLSNRRQGSFFTTVDEALYETHAHPTAPRSPNAVVLVSTDVSPMHHMDAFQASRGATEPQHQHQGATHNGNNDSRDTRRRRMQPALWHSSPPEKTSTQLSGIHAALAEYVLLPRREASPMMPSVATVKSTPASNSGVGDANRKGDTQDGDKDSRPQEHGTRFLESADPEPDILLGRDALEGGTRDNDGCLYPSMVWIKAKQLSSAPSSVRTSHSSAKPNTKRLNFRSRITPRGHRAAAAPVAGATASNQAPAVSERRCTDSTAFSLEAPDGTGFGATDSATNCTANAGGGGGRTGHNAVMMDWDEYGLLAWATKSPLRTCPESAAAFGARGGDGGAGAANESVTVTDSAASHTTSRKATLPISVKASSAKPTRRWTDKVRPRRGESPHTAVTFVEETAPFAPVNDDRSPSSGATLAAPPCEQAPSTPPHLLATMAAVTTESGRPQLLPTASLLCPTTYSMLAVTTGKVAGSGTPAATAPSPSVSGEPSVATTAAGPRAAPSHTLSPPGEYFFNSFHTNLTIAGSLGDEDNASDAVLVSPLPNMSNPADAEGHTTGAAQRRLSSINGGSRQNHPTIPSFQWLGQQRQQRNGGRTGSHIFIPSSSASSSAASASTSVASTALAWRGMKGAQGNTVATLKADYELLTVGADVTSVNGRRTGGFVALEARTNLSAEAQASPANLGRVASRRPIIEDPGDVESVDNSRRRSEPASIVSAEEVQPPRNRRKSPHWRLHASPAER